MTEGRLVDLALRKLLPFEAIFATSFSVYNREEVVGEMMARTYEQTMIGLVRLGAVSPDRRTAMEPLGWMQRETQQPRVTEDLFRVRVFSDKKFPTDFDRAIERLRLMLGDDLSPDWRPCETVPEDYHAL